MDGGRVHLQCAGDIYTMAGGLKMVAITDSLQSIVMILATVVFFFIVANQIGGWSGLQAKPSPLNSPSLSNR